MNVLDQAIVVYFILLFLSRSLSLAITLAILHSFFKHFHSLLSSS